MTTDIGEAVGKALIEKKLTLAFAESATSGRLASEFSLIEDAGKFLKGALVCYDAQLKEEILKVDPKLIIKYTPESMEVTRAIAIGLQDLISADIHIGITGLTCPGGSESENKPVGTMFIHGLRYKEIIFSERCNFSGNREDIVLKCVKRCIELLWDYLRE